MSVGLGADSSLLAVSPQLTVINPAVGCHYFQPGLHLAEKHHCLWAAANYTAWWQRHAGVCSLLKVVLNQDSNLRPVNHKSSAPTTALQ